MSMLLAALGEALLNSDLLLKGAGGGAFLLYNAGTWRPHHFVGWGMAVLLGLELLAALVHVYGHMRKAPSIPVRGKHLDALEPWDMAFIAFNKLATTVFSYHLLRYLWNSDKVAWRLSEASAANTLVALPLLYVVYDFFYTLFHRALHHRSLYRHIHKHHHRQKAPSRGNTDAVNVHPFEFLSGEYNHLLAIHLVAQFLPSLHALTVLVFIVLGGFLASLNHTRFDIKAPGVLDLLYQVKYHDIHHWFPESNYGQYIMLWDRLMGSFKPYPGTAKSE